MVRRRQEVDAETKIRHAQIELERAQEKLVEIEIKSRGQCFRSLNGRLGNGVLSRHVV